MYFKLIRTISYEEEFEIFITGILYCYYYYHHYYDGDEEKIYCDANASQDVSCDIR